MSTKLRLSPSGPENAGLQLGQLLQWNGTGWAPMSEGNATGQILQWNGSAWVPVGSAPNDGDVLQWSSANGAWEPQAGGTPVAPGSVLFEWNGSDTSQFEGSPAFATAGWTPTLTVAAEAAAPSGNKLVLSSSGTGTGGAVFLANDALPVAAGLKIRVESTILLPAGANPQYRGICVAASDEDPTGLHGIGHFYGTAGWQSRYDAGTLVTSGATIGGNLVPSATNIHRVIQEFRYEQPAAGPRGNMWGTSYRNNAEEAAQWDLTDPGWVAYPASWNGLTLDRWGLALQASGGNPAPVDHQILELRVRAA